MHIPRPVLLLTVLCFIVIPLFVGAQSVPEEARRHMARGQTAAEMAKSPDEYGPAITEFQAAARLAPAWPDPWYNLAPLQEKTGKLKEAIASLKEYLRLAPNAPNAAKIREQIYKLEYRAEQVLTVPEIIDVLVSLSDKKKWQVVGVCYNWDQFEFTRVGNDAVRGLSATLYYRKPMERYQNYRIQGPLLIFQSIINVCGDNGKDRGVSCDAVIENEIEVVSKTLVKVNQKTLRKGQGMGDLIVGEKMSCRYTKK